MPGISESSSGLGAEAAFSGNRLLAAMPEDLKAAIDARGEVVPLKRGETLINCGADVTHAFFLFDGSMLSLLVDIVDGRSVEVATIGREGAFGGIVSCGSAPVFTRARVQMSGQALRVSLVDLEELKQDWPFLRSLFCRYSDFLLSQVMQLVACNAFHSIEARTARWLLTARDRAEGDSLALTQEALAEMLGVQRTTVNAVARELQGEGLIDYRRGELRIADRKALQLRACECYQAINRHFERVIGDFAPGETPKGQNGRS